LTEEERARLVDLARRQKTANAVARRARIVLAAADGLGNTTIAKTLGVGKVPAEKFRRRFLRLRLDGLLDEPRPGAPRKVTDAKVEQIVAKTLESYFSSPCLLICDQVMVSYIVCGEVNANRHATFSAPRPDVCPCIDAPTGWKRYTVVYSPELIPAPLLI
jgi:hypothetical protein